MDWISKLFEIDKLPFKVVFLVAVISGLVAFSPETWLQHLQLDGFKEEYGSFVGIIFLGSFGLALTNVVIFVFTGLKRTYLKMKWKASLTDNLLSLDHSEQAVLREFYIQRKHNIELPINNSSVVGLMNKGIIRKAGRYGERIPSGLLFPCAITDDARERITHEMIGVPDGNPSDEEWEGLINSRPAFAREINFRDRLRSF